MPKTSSSASKSTRKKHAARKAAKQTGEDGDDAGSQQHRPLQRGQKKEKKDKKAPKVKQYIPPPKPPRGAQDPVDLYGLGIAGASPLPAEVVVVLRLLMKRAENTLARALEDLDVWVRKAVTDEQGLQQVLLVVPVWAHHFPRLTTSGSRRIRLGTASLQGFLASSRTTRIELLAPALLENSDYIGAWYASVFDVDRAVRTEAKKSWDAVVGSVDSSDDDKIAPERHLEAILAYLREVILPASSEATAATDETDEDSTGRHARLTAGALDAVASLLKSVSQSAPASLIYFQPILASEELWPKLLIRSGELPLVRRTLWTLLSVVLKIDGLEVLVDDILPAIARCSLHGAFAEPDAGVQNAAWPALIELLRSHRHTWAAADEAIAGEEESSSSEEEADTSVDNSEVRVELVDDGQAEDAPAHDLPPILVALQSFLQLGCRGNPTGSYPVILLLLSTMPARYFPMEEPAIASFFTSFWAAFDGRALAPHDGQGQATKAFFESLLECSSFIAGRLNAAGHNALAKTYLVEHCERVWRETLGQGNLSKQTISQIRDKTINALVQRRRKAGNDAPAIFSAWRRVAFEIVDSGVTAEDLGDSCVKVAMASADDVLAQSLLTDVFERIVGHLESGSISTNRLSDLRAIISDAAAYETVSKSAAMKGLDQLVQVRLIATDCDPAMADFVLGYAKQRRDAETTKAILKSIAHLLLQSPSPLTDPWLRSALQLNAEVLLIDCAPMKLQAPISSRGADLLQGVDKPKAGELETLLDVLEAGEPFVDESAVTAILALVGKQLVASPRQGASNAMALRALDEMLSRPKLRSKLVTSASAGDSSLLLPLAQLFALSRQPIADAQLARVVWTKLMATAAADLIRAKALDLIKNELYEPVVQQTSSTESAFDSLDDLGAPRTAIFDALFPSEQALSSLQATLATSAPFAEIAVLDELVSLASSASAGPGSAVGYVRAVLLAVRLLSRDRSRVAANTWILPHLLRLSILAEDEVAVEGSSAFAFGQISSSEAESIASACDALIVSIVGMISAGKMREWHETAVKALRSAQASKTDPDLIAVLGGPLTSESRGYGPRLLAKALGVMLRSTDAGTEEAELWFTLAQSLQKQNPTHALAIVTVVRRWLYDSPRFQRFQNELASTLSGVSAANATPVGVPLLRLLIAAAPPVESDADFIPQQRAMFLLQTLQKWFASDEDLDDEVHALLAELLVHLAPIVQDRDGSHWDFMFDLIEANLQTASWTDASSLAGLYHSLRLVSRIQELCDTNAELKATVKGQIKAALAGASKVILSHRDTRRRSTAVDKIMHIGLELLIANLPAKSIGAEQINAALGLLRDNDAFIRETGFDLARRAIEESVKDLVVEAELESETPPLIQLPTALLELVAVAIDAQEHSTPFLLGWLLVFEHFTHSSLRLKAAYLDQLRKQDLIETALLPQLFSLVDVGSRGLPFDPSAWAVDALEPALLDNTDLSVSLLASHVYMRALQAVPSLVRSWWESQRNKQLSMAVAAFTAKHFSPLLIARELSQVESGNLADDDLAIKISTTGAEVRAIYTVDETPMELSMRLPPEYPLLGVVVSDRREVGVAEKQWRAWILAVQQVIMTQNGLLSDALGLFKRNVSLHFEGVEACAICYSVISVLDRTLPTKRCRTCKNLFHAGCLYKWFSTSSGSTCPLCRAIF